MDEKKLLTLALMGVAVEEMDKKYATKDELAAGAPDLTFATEEEVRGLFAAKVTSPDTGSEDQGDEPENTPSGT